MSIQDKLERILRDLLVMVSKAPSSDAGGNYVLVHKKEMQQQLGSLRDVVYEMMEQYEATEESRNRGQLGAQKQQDRIIRNANLQAQDIYAASVLYTEEALGKIQGIIDEAERNSKDTLDRLRRDMEEERRRIRSNQKELLNQLEDMKDTAKYMRLIEDRNREIAKEKAKKEANGKPKKNKRKSSSGNSSAAGKKPADESIVSARPQIYVNPKYLQRIPEEIEETAEDIPKDMSEEIAAEIVAGIAKEISAGISEDPAEPTIGEALMTEEENDFEEEDGFEEDFEERITYEKPIIRVNPEYFEKLKNRNSAGKNESVKETNSSNEKRQGFFSFGRKS